jgi:type IV pilus assembly protein PilV
MKKAIANETGASLVEILVALVIGAVGFLALAGMQTMAIQSNTFSGTATDAVTLAQDQLEQLMPLTYSSLSTDANLVDTDADGSGGLSDATSGTADFSLLDQTRNNFTYDIFWNIADGTVISNTKTINVLVVWSENGRQRTVSIQGIKPRVN